MLENINSPSVKNRFYHSLFIVCVLLAIGLSIRMVNLNKEYSGDESSLVEFTHMGFDKMIGELKGRDIYPPLTYILVHLWLLIHDSTAWMRMYFVLFGAGSCLLIYLIANEYLDRKLALLVLLFAVFSPLLISISQILRSYADSAFWLLLSTFFMIRIIKGKNTLMDWSVYTASLVLSLYTFYFSALFILSQFVYVVVFMRSDKKLVLKWFLSLVITGLVFAPWVPSALGQFHNASSISFDWSDKGFNVGFLRLGLYARNLVSMMGLDPSFMIFPGGVQVHFTKIVLAAVVTAVSGAFIFILYTSFGFLKNKFEDSGDSRLLWLPLWMAFLPLLFSWLFAGLLNTLPTAKYLAVPHSMFLILIAAFIGNLWSGKRRVSILFLLLVLLIFASRIPAAVSPEFEYRKSIIFLEENLTKYDCLICINSPPAGSVTNNAIVIDKKYINLNAQKSAYLPLPDQVWQDIRGRIKSCRSVWSYRVHGHFELFGLYAQIDDFLKTEGYKIKEKYRFRNIDIIKLEK